MFPGDLRDHIFASLDGRRFSATLSFRADGVVCGIGFALEKLAELGCEVTFARADGEDVAAGEPVLIFNGSAKAVAMAEDRVIGSIAKASGIAAAARKAVELAAGRVRIVSGAAKKLPEEIKAQVRHAVHVGGAVGRIVDGPFIYLDKNYVRIFGGVKETLAGVAHMTGFTRVIQLRGELRSLEEETKAAMDAQAEILMVDTGKTDDLDRVSACLTTGGNRSATCLAFAGDISLERIPELATHDVDILDIGQAIIDAPLADCSLDVAPARAVDAAQPPLELNLLQKTELRIDGVTLDNANLTDAAAAVAAVLELPPDKVMVIDVRPGQLALDLLVPTVRAERIFGREKPLLAALAALPGIMIAPDAAAHSDGILGAIGMDEALVPELLARARQVAGDVRAGHKRGVLVFPTGFELQEKQIEDTNTPYLVKLFSQAGFPSQAGDSLPDSLHALEAALRVASQDCGLVLTTGGVGAEDKDFSVEAIQRLDPDAAAPYLVHVTKGEGRHVKDGIRIAVGETNGCLFVALPGPHDEVRLAAPVLLQGIKQRLDKHTLAERLAACLRAKFRAAHSHYHHG